MQVTKEQIEILGEKLFNKYVQLGSKANSLKGVVQNGIEHVRYEDIKENERLTNELIQEVVQLHNELVVMYNEYKKWDGQ